MHGDMSSILVVDDDTQVLDVMSEMLRLEGLETIADIPKTSSQLPIIAISGGGRVGPLDYLETARFIGADATLAKPFGRQELITTVADLLAS
jgi:CheY-like chemotaxis protein